MNTCLKHLVCPACGAVYPADQVQTYCQKPDCDSTLYARYTIPKDRAFGEGLAPSLPGMWKYFPFLPVTDPANIVSLEEGRTPVIRLDHLERELQGSALWMKDESVNPTGSFKARGISAAVSKARELGITDLAIPTAGNAGGALAAYCAKGGLKAHVFMPRATPSAFKDECRLFGAALTEIDGNIAACGKLCNELAEINGWFQLSTLKEPYRLEGKKTMGYEIVEQFRDQMPDVILYPTGGGTGLIGIWKAFKELQELGWLGTRLPRIVAVQSESCKSIVTAFHKNQPDALYQDGGFTIANGLRVPKSFASSLILKILRESNGTAVSVSDDQMEKALQQIAAKEGLLVAPEGAALWPACQQLKQENWIKNGERVLLLNTGSGYKYLDNLSI